MRKILLAAAVGLLASGSADAATKFVTWTTWLRAAPAADSRVLDEFPAGWPVDVQGCEGGWCLVIQGRATGYLPQALLADEQRGVPATKPGGGCVPADYFTPEGPLSLRLCQGQK